MKVEIIESNSNSSQTPYFIKILHLLFFLSGFCGLIYEITWMRQLGLIFGSSHAAITAVLAVFMSGLTIGYYLGNRFIEKIARPFKFYGILELIIGIYGLASPILFDFINFVNLSIPIHFSGNNNLFVDFFISSILSFILLTPSTIAMGATLPVVIQGFARSGNQVGRPVASLYGINTLGAVLGVLTGGLIFLPLVGIKNTIFITGIINLMIGFLALIVLPRISITLYQDEKNSLLYNTLKKKKKTGVNTILIISYALSGFASLSCEIAWTRGIILAFGSSVYAFTIVMMTFLSGIGFGSLLFSKMFKKNAPDLKSFAFLQIGTGLGIISSILFIGYLPFAFLVIFHLIKGNVFYLFSGELLLAAVTIFLPTLLMGILFPVVASLLTNNTKLAGKAAGKLAAANTMGAVLGIILSGFILIPLIGSETTLRIASLLYMLIGLMILFLLKRFGEKTVKPMQLFILPLLLIIFIYIVPNWKPNVMTLGIFQYASKYKTNKLPYLSVLFCRDGWTSQVAVTKEDKNISLRINGKVDGSDGEDMKTQLLLAELPLLFAPKINSVFILGFGTGATLGTTLKHNVKSVTCCEIEPRVIETSSYFSHINGNPIKDPRSKVIIEDARLFLQRSKKSFDIIINEPSNPWIKGIANLFSIEFFNLCKERLSDNGVICQWLHLYSMSQNDLKIALKSFLTVFPQTSIWEGSTGDILLIGSKSPLNMDLITLNEKFQQSSQVFKQIKINSLESLLELYIVEGKDLTTWIQNASINKDDLPILEFTTPLNLYQDESSILLRELFACDKTVIPPFQEDKNKIIESKILFKRAMKFLKLRFPDKALVLLHKYRKEQPDNAVATYNLAMLYMTTGNIEKAKSLLIQSHKLKKEVVLQWGLAQIYYREKSFQKAKMLCKKILEKQPDFQYVINMLKKIEENFTSKKQ